MSSICRWHGRRFGHVSAARRRNAAVAQYREHGQQRLAVRQPGDADARRPASDKRVQDHGRASRGHPSERRRTEIHLQNVPVGECSPYWYYVDFFVFNNIYTRSTPRVRLGKSFEPRSTPDWVSLASDRGAYCNYYSNRRRTRGRLGENPRDCVERGLAWFRFQSKTRPGIEFFSIKDTIPAGKTMRFFFFFLWFFLPIDYTEYNTIGDKLAGPRRYRSFLTAERVCVNPTRAYTSKSNYQSTAW